MNTTNSLLVGLIVLMVVLVAEVTIGLLWIIRHVNGMSYMYGQ